MTKICEKCGRCFEGAGQWCGNCIQKNYEMKGKWLYPDEIRKKNKGQVVDNGI